jgi:hypothetical protein
VHYQTLLFTHQTTLELNLDDENYLELVHKLDTNIETINNINFRTTQLTHHPSLDALTDTTTLVKNETNNISNSHKTKHLFNIALHLKIVRHTELEPTPAPKLSITSYNNTTLTATIMTKTTARALDVHVPPNASPAILDQLTHLNTSIHVLLFWS